MKSATQTAPAPQTAWHTLDRENIADLLQTNLKDGLSEAQVSERLARYGPNELSESALKNPLLIFWEQIINPLVLLLIGAAVVSYLLGKVIDGSAVMAIVILNAILGFIQEYRAERAMAALRKLSAPVVRLRRGGQLLELPANQLVPGDLILVEAGNAIPADARLVESVNLRIQEAALTGESEPVEKSVASLPAENIPLGDRRNMIFMGTAVTLGRGQAVVVETGMQTQLGRIAELIQSVKSEATPLQRRMAQLGRGLALAVLSIVAIAFVTGLLIGEEPALMFQTAVSMAVAAVPEGLPAVVTIVLALGAQRMLKRKALIRKLPAVETLGSVTVIASDKTGTLTENRMTVTALDVADHTLFLEEVLQHGRPMLLAGEEPLVPQWPAHALLLAGGALCNDALILPTENQAEFKTIGDPTEGALVVAAARLGMWKEQLEASFPRLAEVPFTSERKRMSTLHRMEQSAPHLAVEEPITGLFQQSRLVLFVKGGVDSLLPVTSQVWVEGQTQPLDETWRARITASTERLAGQGLRVLGIAYRSFGEISPLPAIGEEDERDLVLVGLVGMMDPPRAEVKDAVEVCRQAGIRPVMITGDHPLTARQIARMLHIVEDDGARVLTGQELEQMSQADLEGLVGEVSVYARVSPEHKLRIVQALQARGEVTAMTGDGVNDAPALRQANIGVAMGITGTDVSKEAASMVILDDNFASIVSAVEEGRRVYENVRKFIRYTLGSNAGEILVMFFSPLLGLPLPLTPLQILWMNLVTDGFPGLALTSEQPERDIMRNPPVRPNESVFARGLAGYILRIGLVMAVITLIFAVWASRAFPGEWKSMLFTLLIFMQSGHALAIRSERDSIFQMPVRSNPSLLLAVIITILLQLAALYWAPLQRLFGTVPLTLPEMLITSGVSLSVFLWVEAEKWIRRRREK